MHSNTPIGLGASQNPLRTPQAARHHGHQDQLKTEAPKSTDEFDSQVTKSPQQLLNQQILATLNEHLDVRGAANIQSLDASEFTPEKVADRILGFIGAALNMAKSKGADDEALQKIMDQAREGVERGFSEAREILEGLGIFDGEIKANADKTYELLQQGLDKLEGKAPAETEAQGPESLQVATASHHERNLSLQVQTRDGDIVTLNLESMRSSSQSASSQQDPNRTILTTSSETYSRDSIQYSVEGHLDEDEQQALSELIDRVDQFADKFFDGDVSNILHHVSDLGFDENEIAGFSLTMRELEATQASAAYRNIEQLGSDEGNTSTTPKGLDSQIPALADFLQGFSALLADFRATPLLAEPDKAMLDLLDQRLEFDDRVEQLQGESANASPTSKKDDLDKLMQIAENML